MVYKADKQRLRKLLMDAISLLCKNGLPVQSAFCIEATIGITLSEDEIVLVSFREVVQPNGVMVSETGSDDDNDQESAILSDADGLSFSVEASKHTENSCDALADKRAQEEVASETNRLWKKNLSNNYTALEKNSAIEDDTCFGQEICDPSVSRSCSSYGRNLDNENDTSRLPNGKVPARIKNEVIDDNDCTFVKMEGGTSEFEQLGHDNSWMYQEVYNETHLYTNNDTSQNQSNLPGDLPQAASLRSMPSWSSSPRGIVRSTQSRRSSFAVGGVVSRKSIRKGMAGGTSRNQDHSNVSRTLQSLCKTLADQSCNVAAGEHVFCHICGARLSSQATLVKHIKGTHLAMSTCQCDICGQSFKWTMQLCRHRKRYHSSLASDVVEQV